LLLEPRMIAQLVIHDQADRDAIDKLYGWPQTFVDSPT
jgi:hypothetical protein